MRAISKYGQGGEPAVTPLIARLKASEASVKREVAWALVRLGLEPERVIPAVLERMLDPESPIPKGVLWAFDKFGAAALSPLDRFAQDIGTLPPRRKSKAVVLLGDLRREQGVAVSALIGLLGDSEDDVRVEAALALRLHGKAAGLATAPLVKALDDPNSQLRLQATRTLHSVNSDPSVAVPALVRQLQKKSLGLRAAAAFSLRSYGIEARPALPELLRAANDPDARVSAEAVETLGGLGAAAEVLPVLVEKAKHSRLIRKPALSAMIALGKEASPGAEAIQSLVDDEDPAIQTLVARALLSSGADASTVVQPLLELSQRTYKNAAFAALDGLRHHAKESPEALEGLLAAMDHPNYDVRAMAVQSVGELALQPERSVRALMPRLKDENGFVQMRAVVALGCFGKSAAPAMEQLLSALKDPIEIIRAPAARALGRLKLDPETVVPVLTKSLDDPWPDTRAAILEALQGYGTQADSALPAVVELLEKENDLQVSLRAVQFLANLGFQWAWGPRQTPSE